MGVLHRVLVLAVDNLTWAEKGRYIRGYSTVTLRVRAEDAAKVIHVSQRGRFQLAKMSQAERPADHERIAPVTTESLYDDLKNALGQKR